MSVDGNKLVTGGHEITVVADRVLDETISGYDMIVLPGGMPGAENLRTSAKVVDVPGGDSGPLRSGMLYNMLLGV